MTPVYCNSNDYYKKMLELQRRLRRSEEERIRLEERFSMLEHESRSRHETCINRLRMRYIEFLEEQQARDERNHKLLGALDRVDSSLALISAKTDRLGTMRRQYEAAALLQNWTANGRGINGSVAGDSGVASQNNDRRVSSIRRDRVSPSKSSLARIPPRNAVSVPTAHRRINYSPSKEVSNFGYDSRRSRGDRHYESSHMPLPSSMLSSSFQRASAAMTADSIAPRDRTKQQQQQQPRVFPQSPLKYRPTYSRFSSPPPPPADDPSSRYFRDWPPISNLDEMPGEFAAFERSNPSHNDTKYTEDEAAGYQPRFSRSADIWREDLDEDHSEEAGGVRRIGDSVENELDRYMRRIPRLHERRADRPLSPPCEFDQEQNTSGDLLNVTLSDDDDVEFPAEEKFQTFTNVEQPEDPRISVGKINANYQSSLLAVGQSASLEEARRQMRDEERRDRPEKFISDAKYAKYLQSPSIASPFSGAAYAGGSHEDTAAAASSEETPLVVASLAKNGISHDGNNAIAAESRENVAEIDANAAGSAIRRARSNVEQRFDVTSRESATVKKISYASTDEESPIVRGEEHDAGNHLLEYAETLEPWNIGKLERKVRESMVLDGQRESIRNLSGERPPAANPEDDTIVPGSGFPEDNRAGYDEFTGVEESSPTEKPGIKAIPEVKGYEEEYTTSRANQRVDPILEYAASEETYASPENVLYSQDNYTADANKLRHEGDEQYQGAAGAAAGGGEQYQAEGAPSGQDYSYEHNDQRYKEYVGEKVPRYSTEPAQDYVRESNELYVTDGNEQYAAGTNEQFPSDNNNGQYVADTDQQYVTNTNEQYVTDPNEQYVTDPNEQYVTEPNEQYVTEPNEQYVTEPNEQYVTEPNEQYVTEPNEQYVTEPNEQYVTEPNEQYVTEPNEQYVTEPNEQYVTEPNEQYVADTNEQYVADTNEQYVADANEQYVTEPNEQYVADTNGQYVADTNEQYVADTNEQYVADTNEQYVADTNEQYVADTNEQYVAGTNEQYDVDPNEQYATATGESYLGGANEQYVVDEDQRYPLDPNEQYSQDARRYEEEGIYSQDANQAYPENVAYPESQEYASTGDDQGVIAGNEILVAESGDEPGYVGEDKSVRETATPNELSMVDGADRTVGQTNIQEKEAIPAKKSKDVIKSLLDSDTESTIERNVSNAESDFDFN